MVNQLASGFERKTALLYTPSPVTRFHARSTFPLLWTHLLARIADKLLIVGGHTLVGKVQITFMFKNKKLAVTVLYADRLVRSTCRWRQVRTSELLRPREFKTSNDRLCICHYCISINGAISCLIKIQYWIRYCFRLRYQGVLENRLLNYFFNNSCIASYQWWSAIAAARYIVALSYDLMALYKSVCYYIIISRSSVVRCMKYAQRKCIYVLTSGRNNGTETTSLPHTNHSFVFAMWRQCATHVIHRPLGPRVPRPTIISSVFAHCIRAPNTDYGTCDMA